MKVEFLWNFLTELKNGASLDHQETVRKNQKIGNFILPKNNI